MKKCIFTGCATALITPFTPDGNDVDYNAFLKLLSFQTEGRADALVISGTTGESPVLTSEERNSLFRLSCEHCKTLNIPVIAGTGSNNTIDAVKKSNDAEKQGVNGLLIVTPYYNKCTEEGLIKHYFYIADRVSTPIIVYNVPSRTGVNISDETYIALSEHKNIVAVKDATGNIKTSQKAMTACNGKLTFYSGNDDLTVEMMKNGASGVISVASNIIPSVMHEITSLMSEGETEKAEMLHNGYVRLMKGLFVEINPMPVKYACHKILDISQSMRLPLTPISEASMKVLDEILSDYRLIQ